MPISTTVVSVGDLFDSNVRFIAPPYQRRYVWDKDEQWQPLWLDVVDLADGLVNEVGKSDEEPHFLGALVLHQIPHNPDEPAKREIIDGQQRLITIQILIDAASAVFQEVDSDRKDDLEDHILNSPTKTKQNKDYRFKVWPTRHDRDAFRAAMDDNADPQAFQNSKIVRAHGFFEMRIREWLDQVAADREKLKARCRALVKAILHRMNIVVISVEAEQMSNSIFETLNARGTPLLAWDLVKNHIYEHAGDSADFEDWFNDYLIKFDQDWWQHESGSGRNRRSNVDAFLSHFLVLRTKKEASGRTTSAVFRDFARYAKSPSDRAEKSIRGIGTDLSRIGNTYEEIMAPPDNSEVGQFLYHWQIQGNGTLTPVILWLQSQDVPDDQLLLSVWTLDSYFSRRLICQSSSKDYSELSRGLLSALDQNGSGYAGATTHKFITERSKEVETLKWPTDAELTDVLVNRRLYSTLTVARVRMVLEAIEHQLRIDSDAETLDVPPKLWIEHVLPQNWSEPNWPSPKTDGDDETPSQRRERLLHTIGNLTLVSSVLDIKLKNHAWKKKQRMLQQRSKLYLSNGLIDHTEQWSEESIIKRSGELAEVLIDVWPDPDAIWARTRP